MSLQLIWRARNGSAVSSRSCPRVQPELILAEIRSSVLPNSTYIGLTQKVILRTIDRGKVRNAQPYI